MKGRKKSRNLYLCLGGAVILAVCAFYTFSPNAPRDYKIIDVHEHIGSLERAHVALQVMDALGIEKTVLMGSSKFTLTLDPGFGFTGYDENNEELMKICEQYPGRFEAWPTVSPEDPDKLEKFQKLVQRGAKGLKLYIGHGYVNPRTKKYLFHTKAIDDPSMYPLYEYCEKNFIPACIHVNCSPKPTPGFCEEFVSVLEQFPNLKIVCPHYMLSSIASNRLEELLDTFPNLYSDISFGYDTFLLDGMHRISKDPQKYRKLFEKYPNRFMFSTDMVFTPEPQKTPQWLEDRMRMYVQMLTQLTYTSPLLPGETLNGLSLSPYLLERIFNRNFNELETSRPKNTQLKKAVNWKRIGHQPLQRKPGDVFPPPKTGASKY
jgi:predicted TIM-barrel fold metal-dependent hydrolase